MACQLLGEPRPLPPGQWLFPADKSTLRAGESTTFRTDIKKPTPALAHVGVELAVPELRWRRAETRQ